MVKSSYIFFSGNIFNVFIRLICINATYILPKFCRTILQCERSIGPTLIYFKWSLIWSFMFVFSMISEHDFISNLIVVVNPFYIFADIIF